MGCKLVDKDLFVNMVLEKKNFKKMQIHANIFFWAYFHIVVTKET
jgi:hypothetical protein